MTNLEEQFQSIMDNLKQQRDELVVQMHLAKADAKDEWTELEKKWEHLLAETKQQSEGLREAVEESAKGVNSALEGVAEELKKGYERIRNQLSK